MKCYKVLGDIIVFFFLCLPMPWIHSFPCLRRFPSTLIFRPEVRREWVMSFQRLFFAQGNATDEPRILFISPISSSAPISVALHTHSLTDLIILLYLEFQWLICSGSFSDGRATWLKNRFYLKRHINSSWIIECRNLIFLGVWTFFFIFYKYLLLFFSVSGIFLKI